MLCSFTNQVLAQLDLLKCRKGTTATGFLACLHRVANSSESRQNCLHRKDSVSHPYFVSASRFLFVVVATLMSLATAGRGPLLIASAKKHHTLLAPSNLPRAC